MTKGSRRLELIRFRRRLVSTLELPPTRGHLCSALWTTPVSWQERGSLVGKMWEVTGTSKRLSCKATPDSIAAWLQRT